MRIVGSGDDTKGIIEVYDMTYKWSTVCSNEWGDHDANVVCKYLGYDSGEKSKTRYDIFIIGYVLYRTSSHLVSLSCASSNLSKSQLSKYPDFM